jgi:poly(3-hydroxyalkanoate) depolymerase
VPPADTTPVTVKVGRQELRVSVTGTPEPGVAPILLLNGIGASLDLFEPLRAALGNRLSVAFDAPGVGGSPTPCYPPTMRGLANLGAGLLDVLGYAHADVVGLSWGGALAQELARRHPGRVRRLVLAATMSGWTSVPGRPWALAILMSPLRYYSTSYLERVAPILYGQDIRQHPELLRRHGELRTRYPPTPLGYLYQLAALRRWTSAPWLRCLRQPALVVAGDGDPIIPLINARLLARALPYGRLHVVRGGGHLFLLLRAPFMADLITGFFDGNPDVATDDEAASGA